jgi:hypothetical protein
LEVRLRIALNKKRSSGGIMLWSRYNVARSTSISTIRDGMSRASFDGYGWGRNVNLKFGGHGISRENTRIPPQNEARVTDASGVRQMNGMERLKI